MRIVNVIIVIMLLILKMLIFNVHYVFEIKRKGVIYVSLVVVLWQQHITKARMATPLMLIISRSRALRCKHIACCVN